LPDASVALPEVCSDVLVVGGGPAGSTIAALLAERGEHVVLVEKEKHPRFHIGESLLPFNLPLFERLGVKEQIARIGMPKYGAEFVSTYDDETSGFEFANAWDKGFPYAYQVRRSEFDHILLKNAAAKGATVIEECRVTAVDFPPEGGAVASGRDADGQVRRWRAKFLVDASGRDTLLASRFDIKHRNPKHASAAIFGHFTGAHRSSGKAEGNIALFWFDHGWFWFIPLADGTTRVGAVCRPPYLKSRKTDLPEFFMATIALCPPLAKRLADAQLVSPVTGTGNYSYRSKRMMGKSYIMVGDAYAFIDPMFSTGVYVAMSSAFLGADVVSACLHAPEKAARAFRRLDVQVRRALGAYSWYIYRMNTPALRGMLLTTTNPLRLQEALLSLMAGDVFRRSPIHARLIVFKIIYFLSGLRTFKASFLAWRKRKRAARASAGEVVS
jgi:flavin-dependent dehydrogenase